MQTQMLIGGRWHGAADGALIDVLDPATGDVAAGVAAHGVPTGHSFVTHLHLLKQVRFGPSDTGSVVARSEPSGWHFTAEDGVRYDVVARLRPNSAARVAQALGSAATRIGTDQSEWLRRGARP